MIREASGPWLRKFTDSNAAIFDAANNFQVVSWGCMKFLRRQVF